MDKKGGQYFRPIKTSKQYPADFCRIFVFSGTVLIERADRLFIGLHGAAGFVFRARE